MLNFEFTKNSIDNGTRKPEILLSLLDKKWFTNDTRIA